ncbi:MAG TPA: histidine phosphatase family protein [Candidatus Sulfopaludibacter sp.]|nr:histidine phosphatase family protein [Candidatus Sulfopaludibacter sp.]
MLNEIWLIRHGETEWSLSGQHTGRTDVPLTPHGRDQAEALGRRLAGRTFAIVLSSPLARALDTYRLAGLGGAVQTDPDLREWDYGDYEGRTTAEVHRERPDWSLWSDGVPGGETIEQVAARADAAIARIAQVDGDAALFAHGHLLRILTARWLGLPPADARLFALGTASICSLGYERETRVITRWNLSAAE